MWPLGWIWDRELFKHYFVQVFRTSAAYAFFLSFRRKMESDNRKRERNLNKQNGYTKLIFKDRTEKFRSF